MIVFGLIKVLLVSPMHLCVILASGDLEIGYPSKLSVDVSLLTTERRPGRHAGPADCVLLVGVQGLLWLVRNKLLDFGRLVKVLLKEGVGESEVFQVKIISSWHLPCRISG